MIVVSDSSPLISLARIELLELLPSLFERILIPQEVHAEVAVSGAGLPGAEAIKRAPWIEIAKLESPPDPLLQQACERLGSGERGALLLAKSLSADLVLLDERQARRIAQSAGLTITGSVAVLEAGARRGFVPDLRQAYIDLLRCGIRFDLRLLQDSLKRLGLRPL